VISLFDRSELHLARLAAEGIQRNIIAAGSIGSSATMFVRVLVLAPRTHPGLENR